MWYDRGKFKEANGFSVMIYVPNFVALFHGLPRNGLIWNHFS